MNDEPNIDAYYVLDETENCARESLRAEGYSAADIDALIESDDELESKIASFPVMEKHEYNILLIRHIQNLRDHLSDGSQSSQDFVLDGYMLAWYGYLGSIDDLSQSVFSMLQSDRAKRPRNRISLAQRAIEFILREADAFPGTVPFRSEEQQIALDNARKDAISERGRDLERFRHFVGKSCRIKVNGTTIEITSVENRGTIIGYVFENCDLPSNEDPPMTPMTTIRSIISRLNNQPSEKSGQSE